MNLSNLETFITVTKFMNFSKAANAMFVSQSTVTARIKNLEEELKTELFYRDNKNVSLTPAGERFLEHAKLINELVSNATTDVLLYNKFESVLSICAPVSVWEYSLANAVKDFMDNHPEIAVKLKCGHSDSVIEDLFLGLCHVGVVFQKVYDEEIETIPFFRSNFHLVAKKGLIPEDTYITPENIQNYRPIFIEWGPEFVSWYNKFYKTQTHFCEVDGVSLLVNLLLDGQGIGFIPDRISDTYIKSGQLEKLDFKYNNTLPEDSAYIIFLRKNREKVSKFIEHLDIL